MPVVSLLVLYGAHVQIFLYFQVNDFETKAYMRFWNSSSISPLHFSTSILYIIKIITTVIVSATVMRKIIFWGAFFNNTEDSQPVILDF